MKYAAKVLLMACLVVNLSMGVAWAKKIKTPTYTTPQYTTPRESLEKIVNRAASADTTALVELAQRFERGVGVKINLERAYQIYCQAARFGSVQAQLSLARIYLEGKSVTRNGEQATAWLVQAARAGDRVAAAVVSTMPPSTSAGPARFGPAQCDAGPPVRGLQPLPPANPQDRIAIRNWIYTLAPYYGLDPELVLTIAALESNFNPQARSSKNAQGVMQLMPETAERFGVYDLANPLENIKGGMAYLRWLMAYFQGNVRLVAAAYNAGEGAVDKYWGIPPYAETQIYVEQVSRRYPHLIHPYRMNVTRPSPVSAAKVTMNP